MRRMVTAFLALLATPTLAADNHGHGHRHGGQQPYAGQQERQITSLSAKDIAALKAGKGWGFALPAELNGYPGPLHLLELSEELELTSDQIDRISQVFDGMQAEAKALGRQFLAAEKALDALFADGTATSELLDAALRRTADLRMALRRAHLAAHLQVTPLLTRHQRHTYQMLRGYGGAHSGHGSH